MSGESWGPVEWAVLATLVALITTPFMPSVGEMIDGVIK